MYSTGQCRQKPACSFGGLKVSSIFRLLLYNVSTYKIYKTVSVFASHEAVVTMCLYTVDMMGTKPPTVPLY